MKCLIIASIQIHSFLDEIELKVSSFAKIFIQKTLSIFLKVAKKYLRFAKVKVFNDIRFSNSELF